MKRIWYSIPLIASILLIAYWNSSVNSDRSVSEEQKYLPGSFQSLLAMSAIRAYPYEDITEDGYFRAFRYSRNYLSSRDNFGSSWQSIGPANVGGRTLDIAICLQNPNTIYAASASGGLWRSHTGGVGENVWERIETGFPAFAIGAVEVSPADSSIIFVGTGECYGYGEYYPSVSFRATRGLPGIGILKSTDYGVTWFKSLDWSYHQQRGIQRIKFDPVNPAIIWAATTEGTYKSTDLGETWDQMHNVAMATDIVINPNDPDMVIIACGGMYSTGNGIYRTEDGGHVWTKMNLGAGGPVNFGGKARLAMASAAPNIIYASIGLSQSYGSEATWLCRSLNFGDTWEVVNTENYSSYQGWYSHYVGVSPFDPMRIFCGGIDMYQSYDGGNTLLLKNGTISDWFDPDWLHLDHHDIEFHPSDPDIIYFAHDGGIHRTDDNGETFFSCNWGYHTGQFYPGFSCSDSDSALAMGGLQDNFSAIYDGAPYWRRVIAGDGSHSAINQQNNNIIYGSYQYLAMQRSLNNGISFSSIAPPSQGNTNFIAPFVLSPADNQTMYAGRSVVFKSVNGGVNWTATNTSAQFGNNPVLAMGISTYNPDVVYVATMPLYASPAVYRTLDGGDNWENITGDLPDRIPTDIHVDINDDKIIYITLGGFGTSHLYKTLNAGETWEDLGTGLPDTPGWSVINDPVYPEIIYYGNEFGVYVSLDDGATWQEYNNGFGDGVFAMDLKISRSNNKLRVATHGNGVYERPLIIPESVPQNEQVNIALFNLKNSPNPFTNHTNISFCIDKAGHVKLAVYAISGKQIKTFIDRQMNAGEYTYIWDGRNMYNLKMPPGVYIARLSLNGNSNSIKMQLL